MEVLVLGGQQTGKKTYLNSISEIRTAPTAVFNMQDVPIGGLFKAMKIWSAGGEQEYCRIWERYCRDLAAILYIVDSSRKKSLIESRRQLPKLLKIRQLKHVPVLILGNKTDLTKALTLTDFVEFMKLENREDREVSYAMISCKKNENIDATLQWLIRHSKR